MVWCAWCETGKDPGIYKKGFLHIHEKCLDEITESMQETKELLELLKQENKTELIQEYLQKRKDTLERWEIYQKRFDKLIQMT